MIAFLDSVNGQALFWFACFIIFLVIELAIQGLVSVWFSVGALAAAVVAFLDGPIWLQILVFVVVSGVVVLALRPFAKKYVNSQIKPTNVNSIIGKKAVVVTTIDNLKATGMIAVDGVEWSARSADDSIIEENTTVVVKEVQGVKAIVEVEV